ncbi:MAG: hypothetical protein OXI77_06435 [Chloroflexota bacterium]|nr:hypothetical protein [Chloroflexota bacterium]MDE2907921.1 hypothetical protein [Chloroflexota bacterium]
MAPDDNLILEELHFSIDFFQSNSRLIVFQLDVLNFVGDDLYEFHIEVLEYGEWNIISRNSLFVSKTV